MDLQPLSLVLLGRAQADLHPHVHKGLGSSPLSLGFLISELGNKTSCLAGGWRGEDSQKTLHPTEPGAPGSSESGWRAGGVSSQGRDWDPGRPGEDLEAWPCSYVATRKELLRHTLSEDGWTGPTRL